MKFLKSRVKFMLVVLLLFCPTTFAMTIADGLLPDYWFSVEDEIRSGHHIKGLTIQLFQIIFSGFDPDEIAYFKMVLNLFTPKKYLIMQEYKVLPSKEYGSFKVKIYCPVSVLPFQRVIWQSQLSNSSDVHRENHFFLFSSEIGTETKIKICSIVSSRLFDFGHSNFPLPRNVARTSFTKEISRKFHFLSDIEDFIAFFGTYSYNGEFLPIQWILLNPLDIDCTEFATLAFEFFSDKGFDVRYSLGIMAPYHKLNYGGFHTWNSIIFEGNRIEIDPTLGRRIGRLAYHFHFPGQINFVDFYSLEELSSFPIGFISLNGMDIKKDVRYNSRLTVFEFNSGGE